MILKVIILLVIYSLDKTIVTYLIYYQKIVIKIIIYRILKDKNLKFQNLIFKNIFI